MIIMKLRTNIYLIFICAVLIPGALLYAQSGDYPELTNIGFSTPPGALVMKLTFDGTPSAGDVEVKRISYPDRYIVGVSPAAKADDLPEGMVYQDILSDGSRGVDSIEFYYDISNDKAGFLAHPRDGLDIDIEVMGNVVLVKYTRTALDEGTVTKNTRPLRSNESHPDEENNIDNYFNLEKAKLYLSPDAENIIRAYFSDNDTDVESLGSEELLASIDGMEAATERHGAGATYRIQVGDRLLMGVAGEPELEVGVQVRPDGYVSFPIIGDVLVEGKTAAEVRRGVKAELQPYYNYDLVVDVLITEFTPEKVYLLGKVFDAGPQLFIPGMTMLDIFSNFDERDADITKIKLLRGNDVYLVDMEALLAGEIRMNFQLEAGDYVVVPAKILPKAVIIGKVRYPGQYSFDDESRLYDLVGIAGGFNDRCDIKKIRVLRLNSLGVLEYFKCNLRAYEDDGDISQNIPILSGDIIIVPEVGRPDWDKVLDGISSISSLSYWGRTDW